MPIRAARADDVPTIESIVERAYGVYVERIGMRPGPMNDDYREKVAAGLVTVFEAGDEEPAVAGRPSDVVGLLVLVEEPDHLQVENVAVEPSRQEKGIGRRLLDHAEERARAAGLSEVRLYTHSKMTENREMYARLGYVETDRRDEAGFDRVFLVKELGT